MKSQDILILLKLISLEVEKAQTSAGVYCETCKNSGVVEETWGMPKACPTCHRKTRCKTCKGRKQIQTMGGIYHDCSVCHGGGWVDAYTVRSLSKNLGIGISKSEINNSIKRSVAVGLAKFDRVTGRPQPNVSALRDFIVYGIKYVFPAKTGGIVRGIPTSFAAPILKGQLMTAGENIYVWPDPHGKNKGQSVLPLYKSVPQAVKLDDKLYEFLALIDAIRLGLPRESNLAKNILEKILC